MSGAPAAGPSDRGPDLHRLTAEEVYDLRGIKPLDDAAPVAPAGAGNSGLPPALTRQEMIDLLGIDPGELGNDGLTDTERAMYAHLYREGAGKKPTAAQMQHYRALGDAARSTPTAD